MYELVGYRYVDMVAEKKNERDVKGYSCFFLVDENDPALTGRSAVKVFFSDEKFFDFKHKFIFVLTLYQLNKLYTDNITIWHTPNTHFIWVNILISTIIVII